MDRTEEGSIHTVADMVEGIPDRQGTGAGTWAMVRIHREGKREEDWMEVEVVGRTDMAHLAGMASHILEGEADSKAGHMA